MIVEQDPFPHAVYDFGNRERLMTARVECEKIAGSAWQQRDHQSQINKRWCSDRFAMPPTVASIIEDLTSLEYRMSLALAFGTGDLLLDPDLEGGGVHHVMPGGSLEIHADFNLHPKTGLHRVLNLLLYLNDEWIPEHRGELELWSRSMERCVRKVEPRLGATVLLHINDTAFHGHPSVYRGPGRYSIALYYYARERPAEDVSPFHWAVWQKRPEVL